MTKNLIFILTTLVLSSCGTGIGVSRTYLSPIDNKFKATFDNQSYLTEGGNYYNRQMKISDFFEFPKISTDSIHLYFDSNNKLVLIFKDSLGVRTETYDGKFNKKGFYEVYIRNYKKEIPPRVPIIYSVRDIKRLRIGLTKESELVIDNKWARDGHILLLAGGGAGRYRSYFRPLKITQQ